MNLARALKTKNRLTQKISELQLEIQTENSVRTDGPRLIDVRDTMLKHGIKVKELIKLKIAIFISSTPMRENILRLSELKSRINFLKTIDTKEGKVSSYREETVEYSVEYDKLWVKDSVEKCEINIDEIQEELDKFNHTTNIDV